VEAVIDAEENAGVVIPTTNASPEKEALSPMKKKPEVYRDEDSRYFDGLDKIIKECYKNRPEFH
jgi:hypothetical protein